MKKMKKNNRKTLDIARIGIGIALYVVLSMSLKIPIIGHIGLDLGYVVLAVYAYLLGCIPAMIVGTCGCILVSLLVNGWFPLGWALGNLVIGFLCGFISELSGDGFQRLCNMITAVLYSTILGIAWIKTGVECLLYRLPFDLKYQKNLIAACVDAIIMIVGVCTAYALERNGAAERLHLKK